MTGWHVEPGFEVDRAAGLSIGTLLAEVAERVDVRVIVWAGAPVPLFHPTRKEVSAAVDDPRSRATPHPGLRAGPARAPGPLPPREDASSSTTRSRSSTASTAPNQAGDRFDTLGPRRAPASSAGTTVGTRMRGPGGRRRRRRTSAMRWREVTGEALPPPIVPVADRGRAAPPPSRSSAPWPRTCTTRSRTATSGSSRVLRPRAALGRATSSTSRTSSSGRRRSSRSWPTSSARPPSDRASASSVLLAGPGQQRRRRHAWASCAVLADADDHGDRAVPRRHDALAHWIGRDGPALRPRQGRRRRRPWLTVGCGEPQRALPAQRHRDERRHRRRGARARARASGSGAEHLEDDVDEIAGRRTAGRRRALAPDRRWSSSSAAAARRAADAPPDRPHGHAEADSGATGPTRKRSSSAARSAPTSSCRRRSW